MSPESTVDGLALFRAGATEAPRLISQVKSCERGQEYLTIRLGDTVASAGLIDRVNRGVDVAQALRGGFVWAV